MRLTGGVDGGHALVSPRGDDIRPTSDRVREALFSILGPLDQERVLDMFAGAGTLGLEALSRGASHATFAEIHPRSLKALQANVERLGYTAKVELVRKPAPQVVAWLAAQQRAFELIFLDPPYGDEALEPTVQAVANTGILTPSGVLMAEHDRGQPLAERYPVAGGGLERVDIRQYGRTLLSFYQPIKVVTA
ncbi:MAG: 16S rRNA (guanine(966)-N(2))-methyltransferase RsmD [Myxococcota bacterium]